MLNIFQRLVDRRREKEEHRKKVLREVSRWLDARGELVGIVNGPLKQRYETYSRLLRELI